MQSTDSSPLSDTVNREDSNARINGWRLPTSTPIRTLFRWCVEERGVDRLLLSARLEKGSKEPVLLQPEVERIVSSVLGDRILVRKLVSKWPGTELIGHVGMVYEVEFDDSVIEGMARVGARLEAWQMANDPPLPEDPCLFRQTAEWPVLVSVTHEGDAWILTEERPPFCTGAPFAFTPENLLIPPASQGFVGT